jgi:AcrR family transcriptional regulator
LIDERGLDALSMRNLARALGVEAPSLYEYVESKNHIFDAIAKRVLDELVIDDDPTAPWLSRIRTVLFAWCALAEAHPHAFPLLYRRREATRADLLPGEVIFDALRSAGFNKAHSARAYRALIAFVDGVLLRQVRGLDPPEASWVPLPEWFDPKEMPRWAEMDAICSGLEQEQILNVGIDLLLAGLAASAEPSGA